MSPLTYLITSLSAEIVIGGAVISRIKRRMRLHEKALRRDLWIHRQQLARRVDLTKGKNVG